MPRFCIAFALALTLLTTTAFAQAYKTAAGLRIDNGFALTVQQHLFDNWTAEGILHTSLRNDDLGITLLGERHTKILFRALNLYVGGGPHYYWQNGLRGDNTDDVERNVFGLTVIGGAELSIGRLNLSVDLKPELHLAGGGDDSNAFEWTGAAVSARYILIKRERRGIKDWKVWDSFGGGNKKKKRRN